MCSTSDRKSRDFSFELIRPPNRRTTFTSQLLEVSQDRLILTHEAYPSKPLEHRGHEVIGQGYRAVWFLFNGCSFDVGRFYRPDGTWTGYYVDILEPVHWQDADPQTLAPIVDLFLDLWITPDGEYVVLDEDEFQEALQRNYLSAAQSSHASAVLADLRAEIEAGTFPSAVVRMFRL